MPQGRRKAMAGTENKSLVWIRAIKKGFVAEGDELGAEGAMELSQPLGRDAPDIQAPSTGGKAVASVSRSCSQASPCPTSLEQNLCLEV